MSGENGPRNGGSGTGWNGSTNGPGLDAALMVADLHSPDRMGAIKELVDRLHGAGYVTDSLDFLHSVLDREDLESTVIDRGVALPHARCRSTVRLGVSFGISRQGVDFFSERFPERVHLICLLAVPAVGEAAYLPLLGGLAGLFRQQAFRADLLACRTSTEMCRFLSRSALAEYAARGRRVLSL